MSNLNGKLDKLLAMKPKPLGEVTLCEGEEYEWKASVPNPTGAEWIERYARLAKFVFEFGESMGGEDAGNAKTMTISLSEMFDAMHRHFGHEDFMEDYVPNVFGMADDEGRQYCEQFLTAQNVIGPFTEAAIMIVAGHETKAETAAAKKK